MPWTAEPVGPAEPRTPPCSSFQISKSGKGSSSSSSSNGEKTYSLAAPDGAAYTRWVTILQNCIELSVRHPGIKLKMPS